MKSKQARGKRTRLIERKMRRSARLADGAAATQVAVTFRHVEPTDPIRVYAERKLTRVGATLKRPCQVHVILTVDKYRHHGEVTLKSGRLSVTAEQETKDLYSVIDLLADKVHRQLRDHLERIQARKMRAASVGEIFAAGEENEPGGGA